MSSNGSEVSEIYRGTVSASWSPDGESVAVGNYTSLDILIIDPSQDDQNPTARSIGRLAMQPMEVVWSPSGDHVAVATAGHYRQGYSTNLRIVTVEPGETTAVVEGNGWVWWPQWSPDGQTLIFTWGELSMTLLRGDLELCRNQILTFTGEDLPLANLWGYEIASGQSEERATGDGFEGLGVWSP
jgi:WD40 repeat protein